MAQRLQPYWRRRPRSPICCATTGDMGPMSRTKLCIAAAAIVLASAPAALAQEATPTLDTGDTAWMLTSTALVLLMTIPGLALYYGGMVRKKNVLAAVMQSFAITCLVTIVWMVVGYSLAFRNGGDALNAYIGGLDRFFLAGMGVSDIASVAGTSYPIP